MLLLGVVLLIIIALINLSSMQLAHAVARIKTIAISFAFGASNKQILVESFKHNFFVIGLSVLLALLLTHFSFSAVIDLAKNDINRLDSLALSFNTVLLAALLTIIISLLYSIIELKVVNEKTLINSLQSSGKGVGKQMSSGASHLLIGFQVMFSFIILIAASHVAWLALSEALRSNGLNTKNKWSLGINYSNIKKDAERKNIHNNLLNQLKKTSLIKSIDSISNARFPNTLSSDVINNAKGRYLARSRKTYITSNYLSHVGLTLKGKNFQPGDSELQNHPIIVNQRLADIIGDSPEKVLGKKIQAWNKARHTIIGIVSNTYYAGANYLEVNEYYIPKKYSGSRRYYFLLTAKDNSDLSKRVRNIVNTLDNRLDIIQFTTLKKQFNKTRKRHLTAASLAIVLAFISLLMVIIGVNGIVNYMVQVRRYTLGVQLAMGAKQNCLLKESLIELMQPISMSLFFAFSVCFLALGYSLSQPDLNIQANWSIVSSIVIGFFVIAFLASYFPIQKTLKSDPIKALRNE
jgi:ABC-type antimicrobial peptide transport system permease subunit